MHYVVHVGRVNDGEWLSRTQPVPIFAAPVAGRSDNAHCCGSAIFRPCRMTSQSMDEHGLQPAPVRLLEALNRKARYRLPPGGQLVEPFGLSRVPANAPVWRDRRQAQRDVRRHQVKGHGQTPCSSRRRRRAQCAAERASEKRAVASSDRQAQTDRETVCKWARDDGNHARAVRCLTRAFVTIM